MLLSPESTSGPGVGPVRLLGSSGGAAIAYVARDSTGAFNTDAVPLRRYAPGGWSAPDAFPERVQHMGPIATSMTPGGDATFVWASLDAVDMNSVDVHARTLTAAGSWSDRATLGDTSVVWWQDPIVPVVGVASNEGLSIAAWTRLAPDGVDATNGLWSSERGPSGGWEPPRLGIPASAGSLQVAANPDGTAYAVWTSAPAHAGLTVAIAHWDGSAWGAPVTLDQASAGAGAHLELGPSPGSSLAVSAAGEIAVVYALLEPAAMTLKLARTADGSSWTNETIADLPGGSSWRSVTNAAGQVLLTWGSPPDQATRVSLFTPGAGWASIPAPAGVRNDESATALADDGRVAIADSPLDSSVPAGCTPRTSVRVHRLLAGARWSEPQVVDEPVTISSVTALGYAGQDLLVLWRRGPGPEEATYAASVRMP